MVSADQLSQQAAVTDWPLRLLLVMLTLVVIALALWGLRRGWQNRGRRQDLTLPAVPAAVTEMPSRGPEGVRGKYLGTVPEGQPMERLVAAGAVAQAEVIVSPAGVLLRRQGEGPLFVPHDDIVSVSTSPGLLMRYYGRHGVLLINWQWSGAMVSSGIWFADPDDQSAVRDAIEDVHLEEVS